MIKIEWMLCDFKWRQQFGLLVDRLAMDESQNILFSRHHLHEFVEVNSSWTIGIDFIDHAIQISVR